MKGDIKGWSDIDDGIEKKEDNAGGDIDYANLDLKQFFIANGIPMEKAVEGPCYYYQSNFPETICGNTDLINDVKEETGIIIETDKENSFAIIYFSNENAVPPSLPLINMKVLPYKGYDASPINTRELLSEGQYLLFVVYDNTNEKYAFISKELLEKYITFQ